MVASSIDLHSIRCSCGNSRFFVDVERMELICAKCSRRIPINSISIEKEYVEICVKDVYGSMCARLLPTTQELVEVVNRLAYYASDGNAVTVTGIEAVKFLVSTIIISLYLFLFVIIALNFVLGIFPESVIAWIFIVVVVTSFFLMLFL